MKLIKCLIVCLLSVIQHSHQDATVCRTSKNELGKCKAMEDCPFMRDLMKQASTDKEVVEYMRGSRCGFEGTLPIVCCPVESNAEENLITKYLPTSPNCGVTSTSNDAARVVGGKPSKLGAWPWIGAIGYLFPRVKNDKYHWMCGGTLITERYVVTAAHCAHVDGVIMAVVRFGSLRLEGEVESDEFQPEVVNVDKVIAHSHYTKKTVFNDIALIRLARNVHLSRLVQPVCLPHTPDLINNNFEDYNPFIAGWGHIGYRTHQSDVLRDVQVPVLANNDCAKSYSRIGAQITMNQMCAGYMEGGKDACQGDSGGPLMLPKGNTTYLIGIVSYGYKCAEKGFPGIYTRVTSYIDWIAQTMNKLEA